MTVVDTAQLSVQIQEHIATFIGSPELTGRSRDYYVRLESRLYTTVERCKWETLRQVNPDAMTHFLAILKKEGQSGKTINEFLAGFKGFARGDKVPACA